MEIEEGKYRRTQESQLGEMSMVIDCGIGGLIEILNARLKVWGFGGAVSNDTILQEALMRAEKCFSYSRNKRFRTLNGDVKYSVKHSVQTSILLYYLSSTACHHGNMELADSVYYLNRIMHGVDWFYEIELPSVFGAEHPVGSVLGRASYGDKLFVYQNTTIGSSVEKFPRIGENVVLCANGCILGACSIGSNVIISAGAMVVNKDIPDNSIVFQDGTIRSFPKSEMRRKISILSDFKEA